MDQEVELQLLNEKLLAQYGSTLNGNQRFRMVFSDGETEKRKGNFDIYSETGQWLRREYDVVRIVLKYPTNRERFILERYTLEPFGKWVANPPPREVFDYNGYEPFYVFEWVEARPVPPWAALQFIIQANMSERTAALERLEELHRKQDASSFQQSMDILDEMSPYLPGLLHDGEAVVVPDMKETKDE
jgi:hypothetical protein